MDFFFILLSRKRLERERERGRNRSEFLIDNFFEPTIMEIRTDSRMICGRGKDERRMARPVNSCQRVWVKSVAVKSLESLPDSLSSRDISVPYGSSGSSIIHFELTNDRVVCHHIKNSSGYARTIPLNIHSSLTSKQQY